MYNKHYSTRQTSQSESIPGSRQVKNNAGGYVYSLNDWKRLRRFLILGSEGGTYYQTEKKLTVENAETVRRCIASDGIRTVKKIVEISQKALAPKNEPAIFALAMATKFGDDKTRKFAFDSLGDVCRIGTHLFQFAEYREAFGGWGRGMRRAVQQWYLKRNVDQLANQLVKYQQRNNWSQCDLLRLSHPVSRDEKINDVLKWAIGKNTDPQHPLLIAFEKAKTSDRKEIVKLILEHGLTREMIPTEQLAEKEVQWALLQKMPMTALIRNLGNLSKSGLLSPLSEAEALVVKMLGDKEALKKSRIHPFLILLALKTYEQGHGFRGSGSWTISPKVIDALDEAFYFAFTYTEGAGKKFLIGLDVSGSMESAINNSPISCREATGAMAMVTLKTEPQTYVHGFSTRFVNLALSPKMRLDDVLRKISGLPFEGTDCALPMMYALQNKIEVDTFCVYTDNETWAGNIHPKQALDMYRQKMGRDAKLVVAAFTSSGFSIADPNDMGMLDCVGLDASLPSIVTEFARDGI